MKPILSISLLLALTLLSAIAKADQVPPELLTDARLYRACQFCADPWRTPEVSTFNFSELQGIADSWVGNQGTRSPCRVTGSESGTYGFLQCTKTVNGNDNFFDVGLYSARLTSAYQCPSTHPIHIDNNSDGTIDSGDMCDTPCQEGWKYTQLWTTSGDGGLGDGSPVAFCKAIKLPSGDITACKYEVQNTDNQYLPPLINDSRTWMLPTVSSGEGCPIDEDGHAYTEGGTPQPEAPEQEYEEPENGDGDNNPDTDPNTTDEDGDGNTLNEDTEKIKLILTEIEDNTDDLELLSKDANKMHKKSNNAQDKTNALLKGIHDEIASNGGGTPGGGGDNDAGLKESIGDYSSEGNPDGVGGASSAMDTLINSAKDLIENEQQSETETRQKLTEVSTSIEQKAKDIFTQGACTPFTFTVKEHTVSTDAHCQASSGVVSVFEWLLWLIVLADAWYVFRHYFQPKVN